MSKNICSKDLKLIYDDGKIDIDIEDVQERMKELEKNYGYSDIPLAAPL